ncbi:hypothetical protein Tco_0408504 [Tanacetum coccineum]
MSNSNTNCKLNSSNALHNAIMEAGRKTSTNVGTGNNEKTVPVAEGSSEKTTERYMENYKNVSQDIRDQLNAEAEAVQIILTGIDNDIYSTVDVLSEACEMWYSSSEKVLDSVLQLQESGHGSVGMKNQTDWKDDTDDREKFLGNGEVWRMIIFAPFLGYGDAGSRMITINGFY